MHEGRYGVAKGYATPSSHVRLGEPIGGRLATMGNAKVLVSGKLCDHPSWKHGNYIAVCPEIEIQVELGE